MRHAVFTEFLDVTLRRLREAMPVDAVYVSNHGASCSTEIEDTDGEMLARIREVVGPSIPIIMTLDLHCNVSERMASACTSIIAYTTNPHVDQRPRAAEAADLLRDALAGAHFTMSFVRLPLGAPTVTLLTAEGPYADLVRAGQELVGADVANVSVMGGFILGDLKKCGMTITVTTRDNQDLADDLALRLARQGWDDRRRYNRILTSLEVATASARDAIDGTRKAIILADVADNPGGGGRGNTTHILRSLHEANIPAVVGMFFDPELVAHAHAAGPGATIQAVFNKSESEFSASMEAQATVVKVTDGRGTGRRGQYANRHFTLGRTALLRLAGSGVLVAVVSIRRALNEPVMLEMHGIELGNVRCLVVKSRGHFRAGFDEYFADDQILEVDVPGLTSPVLSNFEFRNIVRPMYPLDAEAEWAPSEPTLTL